MKKSVGLKVIAGNWKMNKTIDEGIAFLDCLIPLVQEVNAAVYLAVPFTALDALAKKAKGTNFKIGAQNISSYSEGAYTGEISGRQAKEAGASFVLIGHSERRRLFQESDAVINQKIGQALKENLQPILCIGETAEERKEGLTPFILQHQLQEGLKGFTNEQAEKLIIAYEPVWAIGTNLTATPKIAGEAHRLCRETLKILFSEKRGEEMPIIYGGSANAQNAKELLTEPDIDGLLVGGASLDPETFGKIIKDGKV